MKHTLAVLVENSPSVLSRVAGLFSRRGYNIESLAVGVTDNPEISRMTIVVSGDDHVLGQIIKQLNKLVEIIKVSNLKPEETIERELALFKIKVNKANRSEVIQIVDIFRAQIVDVSMNSLVISITGTNDKVNAIEKLLRNFGILEVVRTGTIAINRTIEITR